MSALVPHYESMSSARTKLGEVLDSAENGGAVTIRRHAQTVAVVHAERLREHLTSTLTARAEVSHEAGRWSVHLRGSPFVSEGLSVDDAIDEFIASLREYAEDWEARLSVSPNHKPNWALVQLITLSTDAELRSWVDSQ